MAFVDLSEQTKRREAFTARQANLGPLERLAEGLQAAAPALERFGDIQEKQKSREAALIEKEELKAERKEDRDIAAKDRKVKREDIRVKREQLEADKKLKALQRKDDVSFRKSTRDLGEEDKLRRQVLSKRKELGTDIAIQSAKKIEEVAANPSPAGDLSLIFNFMKVLDPGSVVRESEFRTAGAAGSLPTRVQQAFDKASTGQLLTTEQRADFVNRSRGLLESALETQGLADTRFAGIATRKKLLPENIFISETGDSIGSTLGLDLSKQEQVAQQPPPGLHPVGAAPVQSGFPQAVAAPAPQQQQQLLNEIQLIQQELQRRGR